MATKLMLVKDVFKLGRSGDVVSVKPGFARNFLVPQGFAVPADRNALRRQKDLQEQRRQKAAQDLAESESLKAQLDGKTFTVEVKVDHEGHMYGSVSVLDIVRLVQENEGIELDRQSIDLAQPIKATGIHHVTLKFKEDVEARITLKVFPEGYVEPEAEAEVEVEAAEEEETSEEL